MEIVGFHAKQMNGIDYCSAKDSRYEVDGEPMQYALTIISAGGYEDDVGALLFLGLLPPLISLGCWAGCLSFYICLFSPSSFLFSKFLRSSWPPCFPCFPCPSAVLLFVVFVVLLVVETLPDLVFVPRHLPLVHQVRR